MQKISAVLIVKNEEVLLPRCLQSVQGLDEIIIADTGSIDKTIEIAQKFTDKIYTGKRWEDDYGPCRNYAKSKATGDWILSIDADEILHDVSKVREAVELAEQKGALAVDCMLIAEDNGQRTPFPRLFKNDERVWWEANIHNHLSVQGEKIGDVRITYGYSPAHNDDPNRSFRILKKEVESRDDAIRETFYLAREYWYRKNYEETVRLVGRYVQKSRFPAEKAEAFLMMAYAYKEIGDMDSARDACAQALILNATFSEAANFMAKLAGRGSGNEKWERNAKMWDLMAENGENYDVLFVRDWKNEK